MRQSMKVGAVVAALLLVITPHAVHADDEPPAPDVELQKYEPLDKEGGHLPDAGGGKIIELKFKAAAQLEHEDGRVQANSAQASSLLSDSAIESALPLFQLDSPALTTLKQTAEESSSKEQPALNQWVQVTVKDGEDAAEVAKRLNSDESVEAAYVRPDPVAPPTATASASDLLSLPTGIPTAQDYTSSQGYLGTPKDTYGINALYAHKISGGDGTGVTIADIENGWDFDHPDLTKLAKASVTRGTPRQDFQFHGTAVMGELLADKNDFGVTGIAYGANAMVSHVSTQELGYNPANAITVASNNLKAGDVLVIEQQTNGCVGGGGNGRYAPMEWWPAVYESIRTAVAKGIHVVEAAGNGSENLDSSCYGKTFPGGRADSGAIIVGAGAGRTAQGQVCGQYGYRQNFSTHGTRVNSFAWGNCVTTTYSNKGYTSSFSGTSSATPIVAGAVASLSGIAKARGITLTPTQMRDIVSKSGTKAADGQQIGTMPDLKNAIAELDKIKPGDPKPDPDPSPSPSPSPTEGTDPKPDPTEGTDPTPKPTEGTDPTPKPTEGTDPTPKPTEPTTECSTLTNSANGTMGNAGYAVFPNGRYYYSEPGSHKFCIDTKNLQLELQLWNGSNWNQVAASGNESHLSHDGTAGYYRLVVRAKDKAGSNFVLRYAVSGSDNYR